MVSFIEDRVYKFAFVPYGLLIFITSYSYSISETISMVLCSQTNVNKKIYTKRLNSRDYKFKGRDVVFKGRRSYWPARRVA